MWMLTATGKRMPLDAKPSPDGNVELSDGVAVVYGTRAAHRLGAVYYSSHFRSCPDAKDWRK